MYKTEFEMITAGSKLPAVEVELSTADKNIAKTQRLPDVIGSGRSILLGMPGAFLPTCTDLHLPGFYQRASEFKELGVESLNVITLNDRWANFRWEKEQEACSASFAPNGERWLSSPIRFLSDPRGDCLEELGMIAYMGRELGIRARRFAIVVEDGVARHVAFDEGPELLKETSAEAVLEVIQAMELERLAAERLFAERRLAAELTNLGPLDALAYLQGEEARAMLGVAGGAADEVLEQAIGVVEEAASAIRARIAAEQAVSAELCFMAPSEAAAYLLSAEASLLEAGVSAAEIAAAQEILDAAAQKAVASRPSSSGVAADFDASGGGGAAPSSGALGVLGGVGLAAALLAGLLLSQPTLVSELGLGETASVEATITSGEATTTSGEATSLRSLSDEWSRALSSE